MSRVLVTGASGYLSLHLIAQLLEEGRQVRGTVRSLDGEEQIRESLHEAGVDPAGLELVVADLSDDAGWPEALSGIEEVHHVASPIPAQQPEDPDELIRPAREGTLRVLGAAMDAGARRVVLTSSFAAVGYSPKPVRDYTEADWTDPDTPGLAPYPRSKAIAERAAWDLVEGAQTTTELVVVNPTFIIGPTLTATLRSSLVAIKAIAEGTMPALPRQRFGIVDVRDVASAHRLAMAHAEAAHKRYLLLADGPTTTWLGLAQSIAELLGEPAAQRVTLTEAPGEDPAPLTIHNERARTELSWTPRPVRETVADTLTSLAERGWLGA